MNKMILTLALLAASTFNACSCQSVAPGHVGIKVNMMGGSKGVDQVELPVGWHFLTPNERFYDFPVFEQNITWDSVGKEGNESFTFQTKEGLAVNADLGITYHIDPSKVSSVFQKYRRGLDEITHVFLRNHVRDALNEVAATMPVEAVYGVEKVALLAAVQDHVQKAVGPIGIEVSKIYVVGEFRLPAVVIEALNNKISATQRAQQRENELREAEAQAKKEIAAAEGKAGAILAEARAQAEANRILAESITPTLVEYKQVEKWNGVMPLVGAGTGNSMLHLNADGWKK